jgi:hypothetical protein
VGGVPIVDEHATYYVTGPTDLINGTSFESVPVHARLVGWQWFLAGTGSTAHAIVVDDPTEPLPPSAPPDSTLAVFDVVGGHQLLLPVPAALGGGLPSFQRRAAPRRLVRVRIPRAGPPRPTATAVP